MRCSMTWRTWLWAWAQASELFEAILAQSARNVIQEKQDAWHVGAGKAIFKAGHVM